jgi:hypothetical protein
MMRVGVLIRLARPVNPLRSIQKVTSMLIHKPLLLFVLLLLFLFDNAAASDGVIEINQTCAVQSGCLDGDNPGFPVTINSPGSYKLTGNLSVPNENTTAILVNTTALSIDLNGFVISGVTTCSGAPSSMNFQCSPTGSGSGISAAGAVLALTNGRIEKMGGIGASGGQGSVFQDLSFSQNGGLAIDTLLASQVQNVRVIANGGGIDAALGSVTRCTVVQVDGDGIIGGGLIADNRVINVGGNGIFSGSGVVRGNTVEIATGFALTTTSGAIGYINNVFLANNGSSANPQVGPSVNIRELGTNICGTNTTCP